LREIDRSSSFRDLIDTPATVVTADTQVQVRFHRRAHLPIVLACGLPNKPVTVPGGTTCNSLTA
jgi:hypothetical protein